MKGELVWNRDFGDMSIRNNFGEGSSPTIAGDMLIVPWDHESSSKLFALDKRTGKNIWEVSRNEPTCWATPLIAKDATGRSQIVMNGQTAARGYDLKTGKELWYCSGQTERPCASAVSQDGIAFVGSGFRGAFMGAFDMTGEGNLAGTKKVLWSMKQDTPDVASPLLSNGRLYFYKGKTGQLTCVDAKTGKVHYAASRIDGMRSTYASPVAAGGYVFLTDRDGTIVVIEDSDQLKIVATNRFGEGIDATPAIVDGEMFIRSEGHLFCIAQK
jgi:outer membrane protein assembly factor BamB